MMRRYHLVGTFVLVFFILALSPQIRSQQSAPPPPAPDNAGASDTDNDTVFRVNVDMVQLNVAVIDKKGNYVTGLHPSDFEIVEDKIPQRMATFEEGNEEPQMLLDPSQRTPNLTASAGSASSAAPAAG